MSDPYCDGIGHWTSRCQIQRGLDSLPPSAALTLSLVAVALFVVLVVTALVVRSRHDRR